MTTPLAQRQRPFQISSLFEDHRLVAEGTGHMAGKRRISRGSWLSVPKLPCPLAYIRVEALVFTVPVAERNQVPLRRAAEPC